MKPSEAMAIGMGKLEPWVGDLWGKDAQGKDCGCALACVIAGYGGKWGSQEKALSETLLKGQASVQQEKSWHVDRPCPAKGCTDKAPAAWMLVHLNDDHEWPRDDIHSWLVSVHL